MIADIINTNIRLITRNVMSVFSNNKENTDNFILELQQTKYIINNNIFEAKNIINYPSSINIYKYIYKLAYYNKSKFYEYINYFNLNYTLWMKFVHLKKDEQQIISLLLQICSDKKIIITECFDNNKYKNKVYSLLFNIGLDDRLIIIPFYNISDAISNSTCQCYIKEKNAVKILNRFLNEYLNKEFNSNINYYSNNRPACYMSLNKNCLIPKKINYSFYDIILILLFNLKLIFLTKTKCIFPLL